MRQNRLHTLWQADQAVINGWLAIPNSFSAEVMAHQPLMAAWSACHRVRSLFSRTGVSGSMGRIDAQFERQLV